MNELESSNEITIFDLIKIFIKRKNIFIFCIITFFIISTSIGMYKYSKYDETQKVYAYTSYFSVGYYSPGFYLEPYDTVRMIINEIYAKNNNKFPLSKIKDEPQTGSIIKLITASESELNQEEVKGFHGMILEDLLKRHDLIYNKLVSQGNYGNKVTPSQILVLAQKTVDPLQPPSSISKFSIIGTSLGVLIGLLLVFLVEFISELLVKLNNE